MAPHAAALLALTAAAVLPARLPQKPPEIPDTLAPMRVGEWRRATAKPAGTAATGDPGVKAAQWSFRGARNDWVVLTVMTAMSYGYPSELHSPRACHIARGDKVRLLGDLRPVTGMKVRAFQWSNAAGKSEAVALHWRLSGGRAIGFGPFEKLAHVGQRGVFQAHPVVLVRVDSFGGGEPGSIVRAMDFIRSWRRALSPADRSFAFVRQED